MALRGMPPWAAVFSSWAKVMPPTALTSQTLCVPSEPVPDRTTAMARPC
jgi:hypothetical protein